MGGHSEEADLLHQLQRFDKVSKLFVCSDKKKKWTCQLDLCFNIPPNLIIFRTVHLLRSVYSVFIHFFLIWQVFIL